MILERRKVVKENETDEKNLQDAFPNHRHTEAQFCVFRMPSRTDSLKDKGRDCSHQFLLYINFRIC